ICASEICPSFAFATVDLLTQWWVARRAAATSSVLAGALGHRRDDANPILDVDGRLEAGCFRAQDAKRVLARFPCRHLAGELHDWRRLLEWHPMHRRHEHPPREAGVRQQRLREFGLQ